MTRLAQRVILITAGVVLAVVAPFAAPLSPLLPTPDGFAEHVLASGALAAAFAVGYAAPLPGLFALLVLAVLEGGLRKWLVNDVTVLLVKDFLALGIYAAVLPRLGPDERRRSPWVVVPLALLTALALVYCLRSDSVSQALLGLRSYVIYVPLLWVAPRLLDTPRAITRLLLLLIALGIFESLLATAQALTGNEWLNESVAGALPAIASTGDFAWVRPTGTFLQTGTLAAFFVFPTLAALALVMRHSRGPLLAVGLATIALLMWGVLYTGSRAVFATLALAALALLVYLLWHRRFLALAAVPLAVVAGYLLIAVQPFVGDDDARHTVEYTYLDAAGEVQRTELELGASPPQPGADVGEVVGAQDGTPATRLRAQLDLLLDQGLLGQATGTMTLGAQYLQPVRDQAAESMYVKVAYELGLPALVVYAILLATLWAASAWASFVAYDWRRPAAVVALGAATLVPLLSAVTFALDYPFVAIGYWTFTGCALAWAARQAIPAPTPTAPAGRLEGSSAAPSRAPA